MSRIIHLDLILAFFLRWFSFKRRITYSLANLVITYAPTMQTVDLVKKEESDYRPTMSRTRATLDALDGDEGMWPRLQYW